MSKRRVAFPWIATAIATAAALVVLAIQWPSLLPAPRWATFILLAVVLLPVVCIVAGRQRWRALELTGWVLLLLFLVASFMK